MATHGPTLAAYLRAAAGVLPPEEVSVWLTRVAEHLDALHASGAVHGDVRLETIVWDGESATLTDGPGEGDPAADVAALARCAHRALGGTSSSGGRLLALPMTVPSALEDAILRGTRGAFDSARALAQAVATSLPSMLRGPEARTRLAPAALKSSLPRDLSDLKGLVEMEELTAFRSARFRGSSTPRGDAAATTPPVDVGLTRVVNRVGRKKVQRINRILVGGVAIMLVALVLVVALGGDDKPERRPTTGGPPPIDIISPRPSEVTNERVVVVRGRARKDVRRITVNGEPVEIKIGAFRHELELAQDGEFDLTIETIDAGGSRVVVKRTVTLDTKAPTFLALDPAADASTRTSAERFRVRGKIDEPRATLSWRVRAAGQTGSWSDPQAVRADGSFHVDVELPIEGAATVELEAVDVARNSARTHCSIERDATAPVVTIEAPDEGMEVFTPGGRVDVVGRVDDSSAQVRVGDVPVELDAEGRFRASMAVSAEIREGGDFLITATATDDARNRGVAAIRVVRGPSLRILVPASLKAATRDGTQTVRGVVAFASVKLTIDGVLVEIGEAGAFRAEVALAGEGARKIDLVCVNERGVTQRRTIELTHDPTPPVLVVTSVQGSKTIFYDKHSEGLVTADGELVEIEGSIEDATPCEVFVNGHEAKVRGDSWRLQFPARWGMRELRVEARDAAGNVADPQTARLYVSWPKVEGVVFLRAEDEEGRMRASLNEQGQPLATMRGALDGLQLVALPGGTFTMGAVDGDVDARDDEKPAREVTVGRVLVTSHEITWRQFLARFQDPAVKDAWPEDRTPTRERLDVPATGITWEEANAWCRWAGLQLPDEAVWEYAARGGVAGARWPWGNGATWDPRQANVGSSGPAAVGTSGPANGFGLFDVIGNAREWCSDVYAAEVHGKDPAKSPRDRDRGKQRVVRGGSWRSDAAGARLSARNGVEPADADAARDIGFRAVIPFP